MVEFVPFDRIFLEKSFGWLTDPATRSLTRTPEITRQGQQAWFDSLKRREDYLIWGIACEKLPVGACGIKHLTARRGEYWGYIGEPDFRGRGIGRRMMDFTDARARELGLEQLYLHVGRDNEVAIRLYTSHSFLQKETDDDLITMEKQLK